MAANKKNRLKEKVEEFLKRDGNYDAAQPIIVVCDKGKLYSILYGQDLAVGIAGFGKTAEIAFNDFKANWLKYAPNKFKA
jgi:hypothetical protein